METPSTSLESTPEGRLIRRARQLTIPKLTIRAAAGRIGMSAEQWGYIERGYRPGEDGNRPISPPAVTLARMARSLQISAGSLAAEGKRPDAAALLAGPADAEASRPAAADREIITMARELGPVLRASGGDRDRLAGWLLAELAGRLDGQAAAQATEGSDG